MFFFKPKYFPLFTWCCYYVVLPTYILSFSRRRNLVLSIIGLMILFIKKFELYYTMCEETFWCIREFSFSRKTCCCIVSISAWFLSTMPSRIHVLWARFIHHIRRFPNLSNFIVHYGLEKEGYFRFFLNHDQALFIYGISCFVCRNTSTTAYHTIW